MNEVLQEIMAYYRKQGAPGDQTALIALLREVQQESGGAIPQAAVSALADGLGVKESFLMAVIRRVPRLQLADNHVLELCAGPNCGKHRPLTALAEKLCRQAGVTLKHGPCMRMCGKGPNMKYDGKLYHGADEALLYRLLREKE